MSEIENPFLKFEALKTMSITNKDELIAMYEKLLAKEILSKDDALEFQKQRDVIEKYMVNEMAESYFLMTTDISSEDKKKRMEHFDQVISPVSTEYAEKLNRKFSESQICQSLEAPFDILRRNQQNEMDLFNDANIEINKKISKLDMEITEIQGKQVAMWNGEEVPLPALWPYLKDTNREIRKKAYETLTEVELASFEILDQKFDELLVLRETLAKNSGFDSYTKYRFKEMQRFDWDESHCFDFHGAVKKHIVPLYKKLLEKRKMELGLDELRPYDLGVDTKGRDPLRIYDKGDTESLIEGAGKIIKSIDDELYSYFCMLRDNKLLDLDARENKAPGGYMVMYPIFEQASVFYNGVGLASDLMVLLHELGHCFHYFLGKEIGPYPLQEWTSEVAEGGSMSMEYIGLEKMGEYLNDEQCTRIKEDKLTGILGLFIGCSMGDEFQHWIYANPGHSSLERREKWKELKGMYKPVINYDGYADNLTKVEWQFSHILQMPYYYIDYAISELLALSIWDRYKSNPEDAILKYKNGCSLGASKTVPEIYETFGTKLFFGEDVIAPLAKRLEKELEL